MNKSNTLVRFILLISFNFLVFFVRNPVVLTVLVATVILFLLPQKEVVLVRLKMIIPVAIFIIISQLILLNAIPLSQRFFFGYIAAVRITLISLSVLLFLSFVSLNALAQLFNFLPPRWTLLMLITGYLIPNILKDANDIKTVQQSRGLKTNGLQIFHSLAAVIIPLLHRVFQRAETITLTIITRGFAD